MDEGSAVDRSRRLAIVLTTVASKAAAEDLVRTLVGERLIACGNILPGVLSLYQWEGRLTREEEVLILMKVPGADVERLFGRITELHPYTVPELIEVPVDGVSRAYCRWVIESTEVSA
ncbi:MAG: divalent-cation tolerance protein CutA [Gemmatimonadota bacterium]